MNKNTHQSASQYLFDRQKQALLELNKGMAINKIKRQPFFGEDKTPKPLGAAKSWYWQSQAAVHR